MGLETVRFYVYTEVQRPKYICAEENSVFYCIETVKGRLNNERIIKQVKNVI